MNKAKLFLAASVAVLTTTTAMLTIAQSDTNLTDQEIANCEAQLKSWPEEKLAATKKKLQGSATKSSEDLMAATAAKYAAARDEAALMGLKCKSVLLMQMKNGG